MVVFTAHFNRLEELEITVNMGRSGVLTLIPSDPTKLVVTTVDCETGLYETFGRDNDLFSISWSRREILINVCVSGRDGFDFTYALDRRLIDDVSFRLAIQIWLDHIEPINRVD